MSRYHDDELGLKNPYSRATCLILYIYAMELSKPALYAELNRLEGQKDYSQLQNLGPFAAALRVTGFAE